MRRGVLVARATTRPPPTAHRPPKRLVHLTIGLRPMTRLRRERLLP
jgi:hypothetical protein